MNRAGRIVRVDPPAGIPGGEVVIECADFDTSNISACGCRFGGERAHLVGLSARRALALVPSLEVGGEIDVLLESNGEQSAPASFHLGSKLAEDLHPVANPAFDPDDGSLYVTRSGSRGQHFPVSIFALIRTARSQIFPVT